MIKYIFLPFIVFLFYSHSYSQSLNKRYNRLNSEENYSSFDTVKNKKGEILQEVIVNHNPNKNTSSVVRGGIKPMDLPQSLQIIGNTTIEQQQSIRLSDVIKNANGLYVGSARGGAQESFWSRGYDMSSNNIFKNGFRANGGSMPEVASLEKVEILKGSAALLLGNVSPGGILNLVTKVPQFQKGGSVSMQTGSYNFYKPSIDIYGPLNTIIAYRFIGTYENSESFRDVVKKERFYINPSFLFKLSNKTEITLQGDYLNDNWTPDFGTGSIFREVANVPRNSYLGARWSNGLTKQTTVSALLTHEFNNNWKLNFNTSLQNYSRASEGTERILPSANGDWNRPLGKNNALERILSQQINLTGNFTTGKLKHQLVTGIDNENAFAETFTYAFQERDQNGNLLYPNNIYDTINIFDFDKFVQKTNIPVATNTRIVKTTTNRYGFYAQDLISLTEKFKVLAGLRWTLQETKPVTYNLVDNTIKEETIRNDYAFSPKVGLVYQPIKTVSLFTSYANSFTPNTGVTIFNEALEPSIIDQYEIGVKKEFMKGLFSTNVTLYQIVNSNLSQTAEFKADGTTNTDTNVRTLSGETTSKGFEIDIVAKPMEGLDIMAGYSFNNMEYTKTTGAKGSFIEGDRLVRTPESTANLSAFYTIASGYLKGLSLGTIGNYIGNRLGGFNNTNGQTLPNGQTDRIIPLNGYTTVDFSMGYNWQQFSILFKLSNITNELNYTVHENYSVNPIAPRQIITSLKYKF